MTHSTSRLNADMGALRGHSKWLMKAAEEIRAEGHAGWGNTCEQAAEAILIALEATPDTDGGYVRASDDLLKRLDDVIDLQTPKDMKPSPTIAELEKILNNPSPTPIQIMPDGTVKAAPNYLLDILIECRKALSPAPAKGPTEAGEHRSKWTTEDDAAMTRERDRWIK